jgi:hypothetical protein
MPAVRIKALLTLFSASLLWGSESLLAQTPPSPVFYKTQDSDEWVRHTLHVQKVYSRVLLVDASEHPPQTVSVGALDLNARSKDHRGSAQKYSVHAVFRSLQNAADMAQGGDLVAVMPGRYAGFILRERPGADDQRYIHFKAMGKPGDVTIDQPSPDPDWMILLQSTHHVIVQGFNIAGSTGPGQEPRGPRAGIMLDGDFGRSGKLTHHIVIVDTFSHNHRKWGLHSTDTHSVLLQDNVFALSALEHSAYVSDGSDNYVIRRNVLFGSSSGGLQCNLDPVSSFHELLKNASLKNYRKEEPTREWALGLVRLATQKFGENNFPDGRGVNFIIEENVINQNGKIGGGSLNLAGLQDSLIQNNLIYGNFNHGIAQWDDGNPYDRAYAEPGPQSPSQVANPRDLPLWGCHGNLIRNNTVLMANPERAAMQCRNGSWGTRLYNNIFINDEPSSIEIFNTSIYQLEAAFNVFRTVSYPGAVEPLRSLAVSLPEGPSNVSGITLERAAAQFVRYGQEPWVTISGNWWQLSANRPDFRPKVGSTLFGRRGDAKQLPLRDVLGKKRKKPSIGALAP